MTYELCTPKSLYYLEESFRFSQNDVYVTKNLSKTVMSKKIIYKKNKFTTCFVNLGPKEIEFIWVHKGYTNMNVVLFLVNKTRAKVQAAKVEILKCLTPKNWIVMPFVETNSKLTTKPYNFDSNSESYKQHIFFENLFLSGKFLYICPEGVL